MSKPIEWILTWGGMIFLLSAIFYTIDYLILRGQRKRKETYSVRTIATIAEVECKTIGSYHTKNYFPVVEYQADGRVVRGYSSFGISDKSFFTLDSRWSFTTPQIKARTFTFPYWTRNLRGSRAFSQG